MADPAPSAPLKAVLGSPLARRAGLTLGWWLAEIASLFGDEARIDRVERDLLVRFASSGEPVDLAGQDLLLTDRRGGDARLYRFPAAAGDLTDRLAAVRGTGGGRIGAKILIDPDACFIRTVTLPAQALPRMRAVLAQELEAATPFRAEAVHSDWYVEAEDAEGRLRVRHIVLKRAALDPVLAALSGAGLTPGPVVVGRAEDQAMPVDLLSGGRRPVPTLLGRFRSGDAALLVLAAALALTAFLLLRAHQDATLEALDAAARDARLVSAGRPPPQVAAGTTSLAIARAGRPPLALAWSALAALPDTMAIETLHADAEGLTVTFTAPDERAALQALAGLTGLGPPTLRAVEDARVGRRVTALLRWQGTAR